MDAAVADCTEAGPVVAEVEHLHELLTRAQPIQGDAWLTQHLGGVELGVGPADALAVGEVNSCRWARSQQAKASSMAAASWAVAASSRPGRGQKRSSRPFDQLNPDRQPATPGPAGSGGARPVRIRCPGGQAAVSQG
jgi:hypothetical protein